MNRIVLNQIVKYEQLQDDIIEGEFIEGEFIAAKDWANTLSGFYCKRCRCPLMVGDHQCKMCGLIFGLTTPPREYVKSLPADKQWTFYSQRIDSEELARIQERAAKRRQTSVSLFKQFCQKV